MYSSGYSQVNKYSPQTKKKMQYRSKGKSCGYYLRIIFFFSSLIQSLIIVSLVLFLVYGKTQDSASETRIQDLEESFSRLSIENVALKLQRKNLTNILNATLTEKARNDFDLAELRRLCNISFHVIGNLEKKLQQCTLEWMGLKVRCSMNPRIVDPPIVPGGCNCGSLLEQLKARYDLLESNFTQTTQRMRMEMDQIVKERDNLNLETIRLRRDKSTQEKEIEEYKKNSKREISITFSHVKNVSRALREKIESLFPRHIAFQLTCPKQREHLEQIHTNCTNLSQEVEDKLQRYLDTVGEQMSTVYYDNNHLKAENWRLNEDYRWCSQNRTAMAAQHRHSMNELQDKYDKEKEQLLMDKMRLNGDKEVLLKSVKYKSTEVDHLTEKVRQLNVSCMLRSGGLGLQPNTNLGWNLMGGGSSSLPSSSTGFVQQGRTGSGSSFSNPASTGTGSLGSLFQSSGSSSSLSNTGGNKPGSTGTGSLGSLFPSSGSSSSLSNTGGNKPGSTGTGSLGSLFPSSGSSSSLSNTGGNKPGSTGTGSLGSLFPSSGSSSSLSNTGGNKPGSTGTGSLFPSSGSSSSLSNTGGNKPGSTGTSFLGSLFPSSGSSSSLSNTGGNKPGSTGTGSLGSLFPSSGSSSSLSNTGGNKPGSTGTGSLFPSSGSSSSLSNTGGNKPGSTGTGFLDSLFPSSGSSSSLSNTGGNKPGSTGTSSLGSLFPSSGSSSSLSNTGGNKPESTGTDLFSSLFPSSGSSSSRSNTVLGLNKPGSPAQGSSPVSTASGSSLSTSGIGANKPGSNGKTSSWLGSPAGSSISTGSSSPGFPWDGTVNSNSGQSKTGSTPGKTLSGTSYGGTGSSYGGGRTSGLGGGPGSISQHLQELQRLINPPGLQEKQDLSRMLG
ncbi:plasmalemma vesicle associated protein a isoform X2 [Melanotaenia boesemani]|uniref:plasmalemma vesicle associated protein a isoform X2 n=1 Tax=Melanotaenia boesemani TaxID=1250792 RepID=UPI001C049760|nr:plasmalemma vesicle associated protein a isoform X2 [Melanotaenia boesemani]